MRGLLCTVSQVFHPVFTPHSACIIVDQLLAEEFNSFQLGVLVFTTSAVWSILALAQKADCALAIGRFSLSSLYVNV